MRGVLHSLEANGYVQLIESPRQATEFRFRHSLLQEVAYHSILRQDRQRLHHAVAQSLEAEWDQQGEALDSGRKGELTALLAHHFDQALQYAKALHYYSQAGDLAAGRYAIAEAARHYGRAIELADQVDGSSDESMVDLILRRGRILELLSDHDQAYALYQALEVRGRRENDPAVLLKAFIHQGKLLASAVKFYNPEQAEALAQQSMALAKALNDRRAEAQIEWNLLNAYRLQGRHEAAIAAGERSIAIARVLGLNEQLAYSLNDLSHPFYAIGNMQRSLEVLEEACSLWQSLGNLPMLADNLSGQATVLIFLTEYDRALVQADEAYRISRSIDNPWGMSYSRYMIGLAYWDWGECGTAVEIMREAIYWGKEGGFTIGVSFPSSWLTLLYAEMGLQDQAREINRQADTSLRQEDYIAHVFVDVGACLLSLEAGDLEQAEQALARISENPVQGLPTFYVLIRYLEAEIALAMHEKDQALELVEQALATIDRSGFALFSIDVVLLKARLLLDLDHRGELRAFLQENIASAQKKNWRRGLWQLLALQAELEMREGEARKAALSRAKAVEVLEYIFDHCEVPGDPNLDLAASFRRLPQVQALLEKPAHSSDIPG